MRVRMQIERSSTFGTLSSGDLVRGSAWKLANAGQDNADLSTVKATWDHAFSLMEAPRKNAGEDHCIPL